MMGVPECVLGSWWDWGYSSTHFSIISGQSEKVCRGPRSQLQLRVFEVMDYLAQGVGKKEKKKT